MNGCFSGYKLTVIMISEDSFDSQMEFMAFQCNFPKILNSKADLEAELSPAASPKVNLNKQLTIDYFINVFYILCMFSLIYIILYIILQKFLDMKTLIHLHY